MRLRNKVAVVVGAGQTPGDTIGNGRATAILFAREGAHVVVVDKDIGSALETEAMIINDGIAGTTADTLVCQADITCAEDCAKLVATAVNRYGRIDILHNNVGVGVGDGSPIETTEETWDRILDVNLKGMYLTTKYVLPVMREAKSGVITFISSIAAICAMNMVAYKSSKAGVNALSQSIALDNASYGIRSNVIMPGLMDTPIAIEGLSHHLHQSKEDIRAMRDKQVPLSGKMGDAWDVAYAALFLASDEAKFITGVALAVDGGQSARIG